MKRLILTGLTLSLLFNPIKEENILNSFEKSLLKNNNRNFIWEPTFATDYLMKFSLSENKNFEKNRKINLRLPPKTLVTLDSKILDLKPTILTSITYPKEGPVEFKKFAYIYNDSNKESITSIILDSNNVLNIKTDFCQVRNGPFLATPKNGIINVKSHYGTLDVIPMNFYLENNGDNDEIDFVNEKNYPPYFVSKRFSEKDSLTPGDIKNILGSYNDLYGDYFKINYKGLICTDIATLLFKTSGIPIKEEMGKMGLDLNPYSQRNQFVIQNYIKKSGFSKEIFHFKNGNSHKLLVDGAYENLTPENFGMESFSEGDAIIFTRFYNSGPKKGKVQRNDVHFAVISKTNGEKIEEVSMVTSHMHEPPYDKNIKLSPVNFETWYRARSNYTGSDETNESLTYRVYEIISSRDVINGMKKKSKLEKSVEN